MTELIDESLFDKFPDELLPIIFNNLNLDNLFNSRLVCRRFKFYIDQVRLNELLINKMSFDLKWYRTADEFNLNNQIKMKDLSLFAFRFPFKLDQLKRLNVTLTKECDRLFINYLNEIRSIEQLELDEQLNYSNKKAKIKL